MTDVMLGRSMPKPQARAESRNRNASLQGQPLPCQNVATRTTSITYLKGNILGTMQQSPTVTCLQECSEPAAIISESKHMMRSLTCFPH